MQNEVQKGDTLSDQSNGVPRPGKLSTRADVGVTTSDPTVLSIESPDEVPLAHRAAPARALARPCCEALGRGWPSLSLLCPLPNGGACSPQPNA